jgi:hypothetical protein
MNVKHNLGESFATLGGQIAFGGAADGAAGEIVGYNVNGNDVAGFPYLFRYTTIKIDVSVVVASPGVEDVDYFLYGSGTEADLDHASILQIGYGSFNVEKAISTGKNAWIDGIYYIANSVSAVTGYAVSIEGGTAITPETMVDVAADDIAVGMGLFNNPKGSEYGFFGPTEWGDGLSGDAYFEAIDDQWFWIGDNAGGHVIADTHFPFRLVGESGSTNSWVLLRVVIVGVSTRAQFDMSNVDMDFVQMVSCTLIDIGAITMNVANDIDKFLADTLFVNCDQVDPGRMNMDRVTFNGSNDATGAMLLDEIQDGNSDLTDLTFNSDGTGYGIRMAPTGAGPFVYNFDGFQNTGYGLDDTDDSFIRIAPADNNADITINLQNGAGTVTTDQRTPYAGTVTINNAQTVRVEGLTEGAAVKVIANETVGSLTVGDVIFELLADLDGVAELTTFNYEGAFDPSGVDVIVRARQQGLPNAAIADDGAVQTDETTAANSATTDDMNLLPATPLTNDAYYFGHSEEFGRIKIDVTNANGGSGTIAWQYYNGSIYTALSDVVDGTNGFTTVGENIISFTIPGDWADDTQNGQGPFRYIRALFTVGAGDNNALGRKCQLDITRYIPFVQERIIESDGLTVVANWVPDTIAKFDPGD